VPIFYLLKTAEFMRLLSRKLVLPQPSKKAWFLFQQIQGLPVFQDRNIVKHGTCTERRLSACIRL